VESLGILRARPARTVTGVVRSGVAEKKKTMRLGRVVTLLLAGAALGASMHAQEREKKPPGGGPAIEVAKPAPEMAKRKWVVGKWNVTETHEKSDWSSGGIGKEQASSRWVRVGSPRSSPTTRPGPPASTRDTGSSHGTRRQRSTALPGPIA
jgi:hypothetical protein